MCRSWLGVVLVLGLMSLTPAVGASPPEYQMIDLGVVEPSLASSSAAAVNNGGQIAGAITTYPAGVVHEAFLWVHGDVLMLGSPPDDARTSVFPTAINSRGQIVGGFGLPGSLDTTGFLYDDGEWTEILAAGGMESLVYDINDRGQVIGFDQGPLGVRAFVWEKGEFAFLDFADHVHPRSINSRGLVVGSFREGWSSLTRAFIWNRGAVTEIGDARGDEWGAVDVNDRGDVVGSYREAGSTSVYNAYLWRDGVLTDLPGLGDSPSATGINNRGQIIGTSRANDGRGHVVLWEHGRVLDLGTWGQGCSPLDINETGQIVGQCWDGVELRAFLWER